MSRNVSQLFFAMASALPLVVTRTAVAQDLSAQEGVRSGKGVDEVEPKKTSATRSKSALADIETTLSASTEAGFLSGSTTLPETGGFEELRVSARAQYLHKKYWRLRVPLSLADRRTVSASLGETRGSLGVRGRYRKTRELAVTIKGELSARWRGGWLDQYQPMVGGGLGETDRYSRFRRSFGVNVASVHNKKEHIKGSYSYVLDDYREDPNYDALGAPTHLVPGDRGVHTLDLSWKRWLEKTKIGGGLRIARKESFFAYSRDAKTGKTHAGRGGPPPNPLQVLLDVEPYATWDYGRLKDRWQLHLYYGLDLVSDDYDGYYSSYAHHLKVGYSIKTSSSDKIKLGTQIYLRTYGANSYAPSPGRPPLRYGTRRVDNKLSTNAAFEHKLNKHWSLYGKGKLIVRRTNYPNYIPRVNPAERSYDIGWDYTNVILSGGLEWRM